MIQTGPKVLPRPKGPTPSVDSPEKQWLDDSLHHFGRSCKREISHMSKRKKTVSNHRISQSHSPKYRILSYSFCKANKYKINMEPKTWGLELEDDFRFNWVIFRCNFNFPGGDLPLTHILQKNHSPQPKLPSCFKCRPDCESQVSPTCWACFRSKTASKCTPWQFQDQSPIKIM